MKGHKWYNDRSSVQTYYRQRFSRNELKKGDEYFHYIVLRSVSTKFKNKHAKEIYFVTFLNLVSETLNISMGI